VNILSAEKITKTYGEKVLFSEISLGINEGEKIGLIGVNGTGKSTLLKIIAGVETYDTGKIIKASDAEIAYLPQNPDFDDDLTVLQYIFKGNSPVMKLLQEYEHVVQEYERNPRDGRLEKRLLSLTQSMDAMGAWTLESDAKTVLTKLGITNFNDKVNTLSGGQKKRVAMAGALINPADLLILDEPTNHIDNDTVDWLEKYLNTRKGALLMVTHDRYFLDRVCNRILELYNGKLYSYQANYSMYLEMKAEREELEISAERKRQNLYRKELEWIRRGAKARSTKQKARIERFEKLKEQQSPISHQDIEIKTLSSRLGKKTIELEHVGKSFDGREIIKDFSYIVLRDDRVGIIGPNGSGKSTLLKMIAGWLETDKGSISIGDTVKIGFFSQENDELDENLRVIEYIKNEAEYIATSEGNLSASQMLEKFLFPPSVQWTPISKLSGGEKRRLYLLRILMGAPNILLLDEPTNDLDIQTLTILESYLDEFDGAVIVVSHDRYFLDRVAEKIFEFDGRGNVKKYEGNYSYYCETAQKELLLETKDQNSNNIKASKELKFDATSASNKGNNFRAENKKKKLSFKEQKEYEQIDGIIADLEKSIAAVDAEILEASSNYERLQELLSEKEQLEKKLDEAMERWVYLNELVESFSKE